MHFSRIFGNQKTLDVLRNDIERSTFSHAYLLSGPSYIGKYSILEEFANILQTGRTENIESIRIHPDVIIIDELPIEKEDNTAKHTNIHLEPRKTNRVSVKDIQYIQEKLSQTTESKYAIALITDIDRMNRESINSLLKMIEEPPSKKTLFLFSTKDISRIPETVISRCKTLHLHIPVKEETLAFLETQNLEITHMEELLKFIPNNPGYLLRLLTDEELLETVKNEVINLQNILEDKDAFPVIKYATSITNSKDALRILEYLEVYTQWLYEKIQKSVTTIPAFEDALVQIADTKKYLGANVSVKLAMEQFLLQFHVFVHTVL